MVKQIEKMNSKKKSEILIVDDHPIVRYGITRIINQDPELSVCGETATPREAMLFLKENDVDAIVLDISLESVLDGLKLAKFIRAKYPQTPILVLSMHDEMIYAQKSLAAGANGYIMKEESSDKLVTALKEVLKGEVHVSEAVKKNMLLSFAKPKEDIIKEVVQNLSERECQVFAMVGAGLSTRTIAEKLHVSVKTIETHRSRIKFKLSINSTQELLLAAAAWAKQTRIAPAF